jgi:ATP-dependent Clp protease protease subunit
MAEEINYKRRNIYINEDIEEEISKEVIRQIIEINDYDKEQGIEDIYYKADPINLFLTTNGGNVEESLAIYDTIKYSKTPVDIYVLGKCYSAGLVILGAGKHRFAYPNARFMVHELSYNASYNNLTTHEDYTNEFRENQEQVNKLILSDTNIPSEELKWHYEHKKDWFMNAEEALSLGIIDKIIDK